MDVARLIQERSGRSDNLAAQAGSIESIAREIISSLRSGGTIFACGNGGSATQATHFAAELVGRYKLDRRAVPCYSLSDNMATVTAVANDYSYEDIFARQIDGLAHGGDCLLALSTSGNSPNVVKACEKARALGVKVFVLTGNSGGAISSHADIEIRVPDNDTARIQEVHLIVIHIVCQLVEAEIFASDND